MKKNNHGWKHREGGWDEERPVSGMIQKAMAKISHTPGPWKMDWLGSDALIIGHDGSGKFQGIDGFLKLVAQVVPRVENRRPDGYPDQTEQESNARLIAAAPELLEVCKKAFHLIKESDFISGLTEDIFDETLSKLADAISKAEGK